MKRIEQAINDRIVQVWMQAKNADSDQDLLQSASDWIRHDFFETYHLSGQLPKLYINVNMIVYEESRLAAFSIRIEVQEMAYLCRNSAMVVADVWKKNSIGLCSLSLFKQHVREYLKDSLDEFINDYLAANPNGRSSEKEE